MFYLNGIDYQAPQPRRHAGRIRTAPSAERSLVCRLWQAEKESQGIRRYQAEHRQHFAAGERAGTWKGSRARIKSIYGISQRIMVKYIYRKIL